VYYLPTEGEYENRSNIYVGSFMKFVKQEEKPGLGFAPRCVDLQSTAYLFRHPCTLEDPEKGGTDPLRFSLEQLPTLTNINSGEAPAHCMTPLR
jgi:hypothetical protein